MVEGLTVTDPAPRVLSVSPTTLARGSCRSVDLTGSGFVSRGMILSLGAGIVVDSTCVTDSCRMRAFVSVPRAASPGARDIILAKGYLTPAEVDELLSIEGMTKPRAMTRKTM